MEQEKQVSINVLLVDDEEDLVDFLAYRLRKHGHSVTAAGTGSEAIAAAERQPFDVAIVDIKMPGMDGIECLRLLKQCQPLLQVIMLTGHGSRESAREAAALHAFRYLIKPFEYGDLLQQIREAHARKVKGDEGLPCDLFAEQQELRGKHEEE